MDQNRIVWVDRARMRGDSSFRSLSIIRIDPEGKVAIQDFAKKEQLIKCLSLFEEDGKTYCLMLSGHERLGQRSQYLLECYVAEEDGLKLVSDTILFPDKHGDDIGFLFSGDRGGGTYYNGKWYLNSITIVSGKSSSAYLDFASITVDNGKIEAIQPYHRRLGHIQIGDGSVFLTVKNGTPGYIFKSRKRRHGVIAGGNRYFNLFFQGAENPDETAISIVDETKIKLMMPSLHEYEPEKYRIIGKIKKEFHVYEFSF